MGRGKNGPKTRTARQPHFKLEVITYVEQREAEMGKNMGVLEEAEQVYGVHKSLICKWRKGKDTIVKHTQSKKLRDRKGFKHGKKKGAQWPELEDQLQKEIRERRKVSEKYRCNQLLFYLLSIAERMESQKPLGREEGRRDFRFFERHL